MLEWSTKQVGQWLELVGFRDYRGLFAARHITGEQLIRLDEASLKDMGIKTSHRTALIQLIRERSRKASERLKGRASCVLFEVKLILNIVYYQFTLMQRQ